MFQHTGLHIRHRPVCRPTGRGYTLPNKPKSYRPEGRGFNH